MSGPPLSVQAQRRSLVQVAGSFATGSPLPQALIQRCQRLSYELRLCEPVILWWSAPQPVAGDSAVAQPTMVFFTCLVLAPELTGETPSRHITLHRPTPLENVARRAGLLYAPISLNLTRSRQVAPTSRSKPALNSRSVSPSPQNKRYRTNCLGGHLLTTSREASIGFSRRSRTEKQRRDKLGSWGSPGHRDTLCQGRVSPGSFALLAHGLSVARTHVRDQCNLRTLAG